MSQINGLIAAYKGVANGINAMRSYSSNNVSVRDAFKEACDRNTEGASQLMIRREKGYSMEAKDGKDGWVETLEKHEDGTEVTTYQRYLTLADEKRYHIDSVGACLNGKCKYTVELGGDSVAGVWDDGAMFVWLYAYRGWADMDLLGEAVYKAIGYKRKIIREGNTLMRLTPFSPDFEGNFRFPRMASAVKNAVQYPCTLFAVKNAVQKLNEYINNGNKMIDDCSAGDECMTLAEQNYEAAFQSLMRVQDEVIKEHPRCADNRQVLQVQVRATERLNKLKKESFHLKAQGYWDCVTDTGPYIMSITTVTGAVFGSFLSLFMSVIASEATGGLIALFPIVGQMATKLSAENTDTEELNMTDL